MNPIQHPSRIVVFKKKYWALGLNTSSIMRLLDIPQFGRSQEVTAYVK